MGRICFCGFGAAVAPAASAEPSTPATAAEGHSAAERTLKAIKRVVVTAAVNISETQAAAAAEGTGASSDPSSTHQAATPKAVGGWADEGEGGAGAGAAVQVRRDRTSLMISARCYL